MEWTGRAPAPSAQHAGSGCQLRITPMPRITSKSTSTAVAVIGIDIGKNVFHLIGLDKCGGIALKSRLSRNQLDAQLANTPPCLNCMEACNGAHHLSRKLIRLGHDARLMPAKYVKAFLKGNKNDFPDAEAIAEAVQRPTMRFLATKTEDQLDLQALHRVRARLVRERTAVINEVHTFLLEPGIAVAHGYQRLRKALPDILSKRENVLSLRMRHTIEGLCVDWRRLDERIEHVSVVIQALAEDEGPCH
jgi:transposase